MTVPWVLSGFTPVYHSPWFPAQLSFHRAPDGACLLKLTASSNATLPGMSHPDALRYTLPPLVSAVHAADRHTRPLMRQRLLCSLQTSPHLPTCPLSGNTYSHTHMHTPIFNIHKTASHIHRCFKIISITSQMVVVHTFNPSTREAKAGKSL